MAMAASGLQINTGNACRVGVTIGSGIGGFEVIEREHRTLLEREPERVSPLFLASDDSSFVTGSELFVDGGSAQV